MVKVYVPSDKRPKRPVPETIRAVMIEMTSDGVEWEWFSIEFGKTPYECVVEYLQDHLQYTPEEIEKEMRGIQDSHSHPTTDLVRASYIMF